MNAGCHLEKNTTHRGGRIMAILVAGLVVGVSMGGCRTTQPPITKLVGNRIIITRSISPHAYEHAARALLFQEQGQHAAAATELQKALSYDQDAPELHARLAETFITLDRLIDAEAEIKKSLAIEPTAAGWLARAHLALRQGAPSEAVVALREAVETVPFDQDAELAEQVRMELADAEIMALRLDEAGATLETLLHGLPGSTLARFRLAALRWAQGDEASAEATLKELIRHDPNTIEAHLMLAWLAVATDQPNHAHQAFGTAMDRSEGSLQVAAIYARWLMESGQQDKARALADDLASDVSLADENTLMGRMELERIVRRPDEAVALAESARKLDPDAAHLGRIHLAEGAALAAGRHIDAAVKVWLTVPADVPTFRTARLHAAALLRDNGAIERARLLVNQMGLDDLDDEGRIEITVARALIEDRAGDTAQALRLLDALGPALAADERVIFARSGIEEKRGNWQECLALADKVLARDPDNAHALNLWGFVAANHHHDLDRAAARTRAALVFEPASGAILDSIGWAAFQAGNLDEAAHFLGQAARLEPEDPEVLGHLASLQERRRDHQGAIATLKKALTFATEDRVRRDLESHLRRLEAKNAAQHTTGSPLAQ